MVVTIASCCENDVVAAMSFEERILVAIAAAAAKVKLECVLIGNAAAALHDVPLTTQDIDLFIRDTKLNRAKVKALAKLLGGNASQPFLPISKMMRVTTPDVVVDFVVQLTSGKKFESFRARSTRIKIGSVAMSVASLDDIIESKTAADRDKDRAMLPLLRSVRDAKRALTKK